MNKKIGVGRAVGKVILMGEHSVVYGEPALSLPFFAAQTKVLVEESLGEVEIACSFYEGPLGKSQETLLGIKTLIETLVEDLGKEVRDFKLDISTSIPLERGMGSSAAVAVAITRGLYHYFDREPSRDDLIKYTDISEKIIHGNPSGLDAATIIGERSLFYIKDQDFQPFDFSLDAYLVVADSGQLGKTREAVAGVAELMEEEAEQTKTILTRLGDLARESKDYLVRGRSRDLGQAMIEGQLLLGQLGVSNTSLDSLVARALREGSLGAKLTGGGLGGSMIALAPDRVIAERVSQGLLDQGARETWISYLGVGNDG